MRCTPVNPVMASGFNLLAASSRCHALVMIFKCRDLWDEDIDIHNVAPRVRPEAQH